MNLCDLHTHVLPCVDDGASSFEYALQMLKNAYASNVEAVVATPHYILSDDEDDNARLNKLIKEHFLQLRQEAAGIPVKLLQGAEVRVNEQMLNKLPQGAIPTINGGRYLLAEFSFAATLEYICDSLKSIIEFGFIPVVAHPERYASVCRNPAGVLRWLDMGAHLQLTGGSIMGEYGRTIKQTADILLKNDFVACVASDAHGLNHRSNYLLDVCDHLSVYYSKAYAKCLMYDNPMRICYNESL